MGLQTYDLWGPNNNGSTNPLSINYGLQILMGHANFYQLWAPYIDGNANFYELLQILMSL